MDISGIGSTDPNQLGALGALSVGAPRIAGTDTGSDQAGARGATASVSPLASIFGQLSQLQQSDPAKLKSVLGDIANKLQAAAQQDGGSQGQALSGLASKFEQAAQTGDLSSLRPAHHHHHHHGGHHRGAAAYQQSADLNQSASGATAPREQALDIIESTVTSELGSTGGAAAA